MSQLVPLDLDRPRQLRFTIFDARDACNYLSRIAGKGPVDTNRLLMLLAGRDWDAYAAVLSEGLKHEEEGLRPDRALRYLGEYVETHGPGAMEKVATAIRKAGELGGVWEPLEEEKTARGNAQTSPASRPST